MPISKPGIGFERLVYDIQQKIDPKSEVTHNEVITDRLGQRRQFDVVIRGTFAGQKVLGVIECKDQKKKVGVPQIEAFVTKAADVNANFKIYVSKTGFFESALNKARHYGIQTLSLIPGDKEKTGFMVGQNWYAELYNWGLISLQLNYVDGPDGKPPFDVTSVRIKGSRVLDWFTNYLLENHPSETEAGWIVGLAIDFSEPQDVDLGSGVTVKCSGLELHAERVMQLKKKFVGITGTGFYDWQAKTATFAQGSEIASSAVTTDFNAWEDAHDAAESLGSFTFKLIVSMKQFEHVPGVVDISAL